MGLFARKKTQAMWYVLRPPRNNNPDIEPKREGPYTRASIAKMLVEEQLGNGAMLWTNEKIFPNPNPNSYKRVNMTEWKRVDQIPDPIFQLLQHEGRTQLLQQHAPASPNTSAASVSPPPDPSTYNGGSPNQPGYSSPYSQHQQPAFVNTQPSAYPTAYPSQPSSSLSPYPQQPPSAPSSYPTSPQVTPMSPPPAPSMHPSVYPQGNTNGPPGA